MPWCHSAASRTGFGTVSGRPMDRLRPEGRKAKTGPVVLDQSCSLSKVIQTRTPFHEPSQRKSSPDVKSMALPAYLNKTRRYPLRPPWPLTCCRPRFSTCRYSILSRRPSLPGAPLKMHRKEADTQLQAADGLRFPLAHARDTRGGSTRAQNWSCPVRLPTFLMPKARAIGFLGKQRRVKLQPVLRACVYRTEHLV